MITLFAHAGEVHEGTTEATTHVLSTWYIALPAALAVVFLVGVFTYFLFQKSLSWAFLFVNLSLFGLGVYGYNNSTIVSVVCLSLGFAMSLLGVLALLTSGPANKS
jgi:hypothetical protein